MSAIATEALTKDFAIGFWRRRPYRALDGLTLSVEQGEVFGLSPEDIDYARGVLHVPNPLRGSSP